MLSQYGSTVGGELIRPPAASSAKGSMRPCCSKSFDGTVERSWLEVHASKLFDVLRQGVAVFSSRRQTREDQRRGDPRNALIHPKCLHSSKPYYARRYNVKCINLNIPESRIGECDLSWEVTKRARHAAVGDLEESDA